MVLQEKLISDREVLVAAAAAAGLDGAAAREYLASKEGHEELQASLAKARRAAVTGVPHFTIAHTSNGRE